MASLSQTSPRPNSSTKYSQLSVPSVNQHHDGTKPNKDGMVVETEAQTASYDCDPVYDESLSKLDTSFKVEIVWRNVVTLIILHFLGFYGFYMSLRYTKWQSFLWAIFVGHFGGMGVLAGAHRLWTHRAYKAHWTLRVVLMIGQTVALQVG